uniref:Uncharacterized protein n=1 Tax=Glossina austeni TaxID=7395 RepID=A0A1A9UYC6_GLOAU
MKEIIFLATNFLSSSPLISALRIIIVIGARVKLSVLTSFRHDVLKTSAGNRQQTSLLASSSQEIMREITKNNNKRTTVHKYILRRNEKNKNIKKIDFDILNRNSTQN